MADTPYNVVSFSNDEEEKNEIVNYTGEKSLQQIFYGAPGTGKSHAINELTAGKDVIRTTFHPDTDYSTFVGAYKPTTKSVPVTTVIGTEAVPVKDKDGKEMKEDKIVYEFVSQAFLQAYIEAWRKYSAAQENEEPQEHWALALGLSNLKPVWVSVSTKSTVTLSIIGKVIGSTSSLTPSTSSSQSSSAFSASSFIPYCRPEQPPPEMVMRSPITGVSEPRIKR